MSQVQVKSQKKENFRQSIKAGVHSLSADAPTEHGGEDSGPNPHDLMLASLGACTSVTLQMYAKRKGWDLQQVTVDLKDEEVEQEPGKKMTVITREISVEGNLSQDEVDGLKAVADKCQIHRLLNGPKEIKTEIKKLTTA